MAKNKIVNYLVFGVPVAIGLYFIYKSVKKPKKGQDAPPQLPPQTNSSVEPNNNGGQKPVVVKYFPLKKGSKGAKVTELQNAILGYDNTLLPKFGADGDFGSETEAAVVKLLNKKTVDSQEDIKKILELKKTQENQAANAKLIQDRTALSNKLVALYNSKVGNMKYYGRAYYQFYALNKTLVSRWKVTTDGRENYWDEQTYNAGAKIATDTDTMSNQQIYVQKEGYIVCGFYSTIVGSTVKIVFSPFGVELKEVEKYLWGK